MPLFETKTIAELTETLIDYRGKTPEKNPNGVKLITAKVIKGGFIQEGNHEFIAEENYDSWMRRGLPRQWDILITTEAPLGEVAQLRTSEKVALAQRVILLRGNPSLIEQGYYFQALKSEFVQAELKSRATGTTVLGIKQSELRKVRIPYYPLATQRKIAAILSAYDDLIENNTRRIKILEEMAQAIYREWFVHFRFPGHEGVRMVESKLGLIPEGWEVKNLFKIANVTYGFPFKSAQFTSEQNDKPVIRIRNILNNFTDNFTNESVSEKYLVKNGDILVGMDGDFHMGKWAGGLAYLNQRVVRFRPNGNISSYYLYLSLQKPIHYFDSTVTGTTVAHLSDEDLKTINLLVPNSTTLKITNQVLNSLFEQEIILKIKNDNLRHTRDFLLPKLISGDLDVSELDIVIPEENT